MDRKLTKAERARMLRFKRPALASFGFYELRQELSEIGEACAEIHWFIDQNDETLINALENDYEEEYEFKIAFADLEAKSERLEEAIHEWSCWNDDEFSEIYDDCTVALIGNKYKSVGYDYMEEDYYELTSYEENLAYTEAGKRLMRKTKADMLSTIGQCFGILIAFLDLRQSYDYLKAAMDILRDENTSLIKVIKEIQTSYEAAEEEGFYLRGKCSEQFNQLLKNLPDKVWLE